MVTTLPYDKREKWMPVRIHNGCFFFVRFVFTVRRYARFSNIVYGRVGCSISKSPCIGGSNPFRQNQTKYFMLLVFIIIFWNVWLILKKLQFTDKNPSSILIKLAQISSVPSYDWLACRINMFIKTSYIYEKRQKIAA